MKQLLIILLVIFSANLFAQEQVERQKVQGLRDLEPRFKSQDSRQNLSNSKLSTNKYKPSKAFGDTIWYEDFDSTRWSQYGLGEGPENWKFQDNTENGFLWGWSKNGPRGRYTSPNGGVGTIKEDLLPSQMQIDFLDEHGGSASNGFMQIEMDWFNTDSSGQLVENYIAMNSWVQAMVNLTDFPSVLIRYNQYHRWCCSGGNQLSLFVTSDYDAENPENVHWLEYDSRGLLAASSNHTSFIDHQMTFDISAIAGGRDSVLLRWQVIGASHYYWIIDDIFITEPPVNELAMTRAWWDYGEEPYEGEGADPDYDWHGGYTKIPVDQVQDFVGFRAAVTNIGTATQENVKLDVTIFNENQEVFNIQSSPITMDPGDKDTLSLNPYFKPQTQGTYMVSSTVISENIDEASENNSFTYEFEITENEYSRVYDAPFSERIMTGAWVGGGRPGDVLMVKYELYEWTRITSISTYFWDNNGDEQIADIEAGNFKMIGRLYPSDPATGEPINNPILSTEERVMTLQDTIQWITLDFIQEGLNDFLEPGTYYAGIETHTSSTDIDFEIAEDKRIQQPGDNAYCWFSDELGYIQANPAICIETNPWFLGFEVEIIFDYSSYYFADNYTVWDFDPLIDSVFITGDMFDPPWPMPGSIDSLRMTYLEDEDVFYIKLNLFPGHYLYKYFLNSGWDGGEWDGPPEREFEIYSDTTIIDRYVNDIPEMSKINYSVYPNPTNSTLKIRSNYQLKNDIKIYNILGKEFYIKPIINLNEASIDVSHFDNGIYFLKINNETCKIIISH